MTADGGIRDETLAVHWSRFDDVLRQAGDLAGKAVVTYSLPMTNDNSGLVVGLASSGAEELAKMLPKARVVCGKVVVTGG